MGNEIRVLVVDDSTLYRKIVRDALTKIPGVEVLGHATNGRQALEKIRLLKPDLITLDIEMPELDGLGVLTELRKLNNKVPCIMLSSLTESGARMTHAALDLGAFDFVLKPQGNDATKNTAQLRFELQQKIEAYRGQVTKIAPPVSKQPPARAVPKPTPVPTEFNSKPISQSKVPPEIVVIGVSTGGPAALSRVIPKLPGDLPVPVVIVQHMPALFTESLARSLDESSDLNVVEAKAGQELQPGHAYIAPGGKQLKIATAGSRRVLRVTNDAPVKNCRPSVDYLFNSVAEIYGNTALAIVMTGMGDDGADGCQLLQSKGAEVMVQEESTCVVYGMPGSVMQACTNCQVVPLERIAARIEQVLGASACN